MNIFFHLITLENGHVSNSPQRTQTSQQNNDLAKRLVVTQQIDSAMEILDNLRTDKKRPLRKELDTPKLNHRIHFSTSVDYSNYPNADKYHLKPMTAMTTTTAMPNKVYIKPINKNRLSLNKSITPHTSRLDINSPLAKLDTIDKYSEWKRGWMQQLENT